MANDDGSKQWRILSIDGGGIYGYTAALWLRELCERDPDFLKADSVDVFAGCSSGAINSLLLATEESPRDAVLGGKLERFWEHPGTFTNSDPVNNMLSYYGITGWYGEKDFLDLLGSAFGDKTLGEVPHKVLVSCFDWHGLGGQPDRLRQALSETAQPSDAVHQMLGMFSHFVARTAAADDEVTNRRWKPHFFNNFEPLFNESDDSGFRLVDIGYAAATPPGFRAMRAGLGDGASFSANPGTNALAALIAHTDVSVLERASVLSLGDGARVPHTWWASGNFGFLTQMMMPTNPAQGALFPSMAYASLQPSSENEERTARGFLRDRDRLRQHYYRLNPPVMALPTLTAAFVAKWKPVRAGMLDHIRAGVRSEASRKAVDKALEFIAGGSWTAPAERPQ